jgi:NMD protein affecting ribosome stability and mRNA decay
MPSREIRTKRKLKGLCPDCGGTNTGSTKTCSKCIERQRAKYKKYKEDNRCPRCSRKLDDLRVTLCQACTLRRVTLPFGKFPHELEV